MSAITDQGRPFPSPFPLPFVGRRADVGALRLALDSAMEGRGSVVLLDGESGVGKSRLVEVLRGDAESRGVAVAVARGYALESSRPFGVWSDALAPVLQAMGEGQVAVLARGVEWELSTIVPAFAPRAGLAAAGAHPTELEARGRLFWNFLQFLGRLAHRAPLMLVLEDIQYADASSLELAHFVGRHLSRERVLLVLTHATGNPTSEAVQQLERSLVQIPTTVARHVTPLTGHDTTELVRRAFGGTAESVTPFATALHAHTGGLPFFLDETLKSLVASGRLHRGAEGWKGLEGPVEPALPSSVRSAIAGRLDALPPEARRVAEVVALAGARASLDVLERVTALDADRLASALDLLCTRQVLREPVAAGAPYEFPHNMVQLTVASTLSEARARALHRSLAAAIDAHAGPGRAGDVALHMARGGLADTPAALPHLLQAGRNALSRRADPEAATWLSEALSLVDRLPAPALPPQELVGLLEDVAVAKLRMGDGAAARGALERALALATAQHDDARRAGILRRLANTAVIEGRVDDALAAFHEAGEAALRCGRSDMVLRIRVATAMALQSIGRSAEGKALVESAIPEADASGDFALQARVHRALVLLYGWTGPLDKVEHHSRKALQAAHAAGDDDVAWSVHWALASLEGLRGNAAGVARHRAEAERLATVLKSPVMQAATAEIAIEYASAAGEWAEGLKLAEQFIPLARAIAPRTLLPRILVWTGLLLIGRDDLTRAAALLDEAWELSGAASARDGHPEAVHNIILAHTGRAALHVALGEWEKAARFAEEGLALADQYGYVVWAIHRLLPILMEAYLWLQDYQRTEQAAKRIRAESVALGHRLGLAWASAAEALIARLRDGSPDAADRLVAAARELEEVPFVFHAARLRRNAAQLLESDGRIDEAVSELRRAHDMFLRLGAELELRGTRSHLRSLGVRLPPRHVMEGADALTGRELEIARLVSRRLSNKEVARELDLSARTVGTHLSNIFRKLGVDSRGALADMIRDHPVLAPPAE